MALLKGWVVLQREKKSDPSVQLEPDVLCWNRAGGKIYQSTQHEHLRIESLGQARRERCPISWFRVWTIFLISPFGPGFLLSLTPEAAVPQSLG